ncbi:O-antigen ligase family protein [Arthrobacter sp.]|uniref:O-antigen ligase family protein n=1 Tax=Arthrobacter sp. TaxID=1667 RepID=UPI003395CE33
MGNPNNAKRFDGAKMIPLVGLLILTILVHLSVSQPVIAAGVIGAAVYVGVLVKAGVWRTMVGTSVLVSVLRSGPPGVLLGEAAWYALQFGPILAAWAMLLKHKPAEARQSDRNVVLFLILFVLAALATNLTSLTPSATLPQTVLLTVMTGFLIFTYQRRWITKEVIQADVAIVFSIITAVHLVAVASVFVGQAWAFDPDYGRFRGLLSNANYAGMMSAIGLSIGLYLLRAPRRGRVAVMASMVVLLVALLMSGSRGSLLAVIMGVVVLVLSRAGRKVIIPLASLAGLATIFAVLIVPKVFDGLDKFFFRDAASPDITSGRFEIYLGMLSLFSHSPFTGTGYRSTEALSPGASGLTGHNIYLTILTETGLFGALFFAGLSIAVLAASGAGKVGRPLLVVVVTIAAVELTESSIYGWGGPTALTAWLMILAFAASGRFLKEVETAAQDQIAAAVSVRPLATLTR